MSRLLLTTAGLLLSVVAADSCPDWFDELGSKWIAQTPDSPGLQLSISAPRCGYDCQGSWASPLKKYARHPPLEDDTPSRLGSATKPFTAITVMQLVEQGLMDVNTPIIEYLPDWAISALEDHMGVKYAGQITPWMLLHHTSGLPNDVSLTDLFETALLDHRPDVQPTHQEVLEYAMHFTPTAAPGDKWEYADVGFHYLGAAIEHVTGAKLGTAVRAASGWDSLGMTATYWEGTDEHPDGLPALARQYVGPFDTTDFGHPVPYGGSGVISNAVDLDRFSRAFHTGLLLGEEGMNLTYTRVPTGDGTQEYGCGWLWDYIGVREAWFHRGAWAAWMYYVPSLDLSVGGAFNQLARRPSVPVLMEEIVQRMLKSGCR